MKDRITAFIAIVLLASLAGVSYWYSQTTRFKKIATPVSREGPDFVAHGVTMTQFDETGRATNRLHAGEVMHFAADDHSELSQPRRKFSAREFRQLRFFLVRFHRLREHAFKESRDAIQDTCPAFALVFDVGRQKSQNTLLAIDATTNLARVPGNIWKILVA